MIAVLEAYELRTKVRLGVTYKGMYGGLGGTFKEYTITLVRGLYEPESKLLKGGYRRDSIGDYYRGY